MDTITQQIVCLLLLAAVLLAVNLKVNSTRWLKLVSYWLMITSIAGAAVLIIRWVAFL